MDFHVLSSKEGIYVKYFPLIVKMHIESVKNEVATKNPNVLCDMELILGRPFIMPLFECVHTLIKFSQVKGVFVYNFMDVIKMAQHELFKLYYNPFTKYENPTFYEFNHSILTLTNGTFSMNWFFYCNGGNEFMYLAFSFDVPYLLNQ